MSDSFWTTALYSGLGLGLATEYHNINNAYHTLGRDTYNLINFVNIFWKLKAANRSKLFLTKLFVENAKRFPQKVKQIGIMYSKMF